VTVQVIFDDTLAVPVSLREQIGVERFGSLVFQRRSRFESMRVLATETGSPPPIHLRTRDDIASLIRRLREKDDNGLYLFCSSHLIPTCGQERLLTFLKQIQYSPTELHIQLNNGRNGRARQGWLLLRGPLLHKFLIKQQEDELAGFFEQHGDKLLEVGDRLALIDVSDEHTLYDFLSGRFEARHFNSVERDEYTVIKRSHDRAKLKREFNFYYLVPPRMQMFLVQPFDFQDNGEIASYRMERLCLPDMALQWVHGAFQPQEFERFLQHIFHFISIRPERRVDKAKAAAIRDALYIEKVRVRIAALKQLPAYAKLAPLMDSACGGIDFLFTRYLQLFEGMRKRFPSDRLVAGHGDPCFCNIIYSKTSQYMRLIDPRGADCEDDLYTDPYYDLAKLSHSIQGGYDLINHDKFDVAVDDNLDLRLVIEDPSPAWAARMFLDQLEKGAFDASLTRLCEASLFISMLPLHIDHPRKVLGFAINAAGILDTLSGKRGTP
jgi:hypothetical protein